MALFDETELRKKFHQLTAEAAAIKAKAAPIRQEWDDARSKEDIYRINVLDPIRRRMEAAEAGLHEIERDRGMISRMLSGRTGDAPETITLGKEPAKN